MRIISKVLKTMAMLSAVAVMLSACGKDSGTNKDGIELSDSSKLVVYTNAEFPPFEFVRDGKIVGVDIEIAEAIADKLGVELEILNADFDGIVASISSGKGDIAISGITITDERKASVNFSDPYIKSVQYLILPLDSTVTNIDDLKGKRIGAATGFTGSFVVDDEINDGALTGSGATLTEYNTAIDASLDITNGKLDAVVMDELVAQSIANENSDKYKAIKLIFADGSDTAEEIGVIMAKNKPNLQTAVNEVIKELKDSGKIDEYVVSYSK